MATPFGEVATRLGTPITPKNAGSYSPAGMPITPSVNWVAHENAGYTLPAGFRSSAESSVAPVTSFGHVSPGLSAMPITPRNAGSALQSFSVQELRTLLAERQAAVMASRAEFAAVKQASSESSKLRARLEQLEAGLLSTLPAGSVVTVDASTREIQEFQAAACQERHPEHRHAVDHRRMSLPKHYEAEMQDGDSFHDAQARHLHRGADGAGAQTQSKCRPKDCDVDPDEYVAPPNVVLGREYLAIDLRAQENEGLRLVSSYTKHPANEDHHYGGHIAAPLHMGSRWWLPDRPGEAEDALAIDWLGRAKHGLPSKNPSRSRGAVNTLPSWLY